MDRHGGGKHPISELSNTVIPVGDCKTAWQEFTREPTDGTERPHPIKEKALVERLIDESRTRLAEEQTDLAELEAHLAIVERRLSGGETHGDGARTGGHANETAELDPENETVG
jgi:hypothetical protein